MSAGVRPDLDRLTTAVDSLGAAFAAVETESLTLDTLQTASALASRATAMIDGFRADLARKARDLRQPGNPLPPNDALNPKGRRPAGRPEQDSARADLFDDLTELGEATRRGELPGDYADVINRATARLSNSERDAFIGRHRDALTKRALEMDLHRFRSHVRALVASFATNTAVERAERQRRNRRGSVWEDAEDGMTKLFAAFEPETGARIRKAVDEEVDRIYRAKRDDPNDQRTYHQVVADAIANLILAARRSGASRTELVVLVDLHTLVADRTDADERATDGADTASAGRCCEASDSTPLPVETVRRLACEADLIPAVLNGDGAVLDLGRAQRLASPAQRLALRVMYPGCAFGGCVVPFDRCEIHHVDPFGPPVNGATNLDKLVPVCPWHHHDIHDHHLTLSLDPRTRTLTVTHPDGSAATHLIPTRRRPPPHSANGDLPRSA